MHYQRVRHYGSVELPIRLTTEGRFWSKVDKAGPIPTRRSDLGLCWIWTAGRAGEYGFWQYGGRISKTKVLVHRYSYELAYGLVPAGLHIDHLCGVRLCVRPSHLEAVTQAENNRRAAKVRVRKTHCPRGHEYAGSNLYVTPRNQYTCRACCNARARARAARKRAPKEESK
jgi:HNH endonuclease